MATTRSNALCLINVVHSPERNYQLYYRNNKQTSSTLLRDINEFYWARKRDAIASSFLTIKTRLYHVIKYEKCGCYFYSKMEHVQSTYKPLNGRFKTKINNKLQNFSFVYGH